ncbi:hypothetical protein M422DRAFT_272990 [Sphaerobolus stellatus SS14]|uniref:Uncharacterized protein n=1 Tax=Sphaerobolus stellatus (strain SS14) TaxID=990650 RepID=A0A0C9UA95_SPHS4|nr:hypothetical protein M422DRAFT_272990 [Sphaerobolus stellatus SS14]
MALPFTSISWEASCHLIKVLLRMNAIPAFSPGFWGSGSPTPFKLGTAGHIQPNCPFLDKDRRVAGARIEEVILEEDEDQIEEFHEDVPHPEEQQDWEDQPEEDDQQYCFDDDEYKTRSIDNEDVRVNAVITDSAYKDRRKLYGIRVWEAETDLRVSAVVQTGRKEQPVYNHQARRKARPLPTRGKENETISVFWDISGTKAHCLLDSGCEGIMISSEFVRANKLPKF